MKLSSINKNIGVSLILLIFFINLWIPKGGFKINDVPLTWGYLLSFISFIYFGFNFLVSGKVKSRSLLVYFSSIPITLYSVIYFFMAEEVDIGKVISFIINVAYFPLFFCVLAQYVQKPLFGNNFAQFEKILFYGLVFVSIFGIINFFYRPLAGHYIQIPGITSNLQDLAGLDYKYNNRGGFFFKLSSTYNNGNIFGVCMVMMLPLTIFIRNIKKQRLVLFLLSISLVLTLSRTVWIGLVLFLLSLINLKTLARIVMVIPILLIVIYLTGNELIGFDFNYFYDTNLGGRWQYLKSVNLYNIGMDTSIKFHGMREIVITSILDHFGWIGVVLFFSYLISPLIFLRFKTKWNHRLRVSLILYIILTFIDGAFSLIPVMFLYWFIVFLNTDRIYINE